MNNYRKVFAFSSRQGAPVDITSIAENFNARMHTIIMHDSISYKGLPRADLKQGELVVESIEPQFPPDVEIDLSNRADFNYDLVDQIMHQIAEERALVLAS